MKSLFTSLIIIFLNIPVLTQVIFSEEDVNICKSKFEFSVSNKLSQLPINDVIVEIGKTFLGWNMKLSH